MKYFIFMLLSIMVVKTNATDNSNNRQINCIAQAIYHESRGEPLKGQIAVAQVVLNRVEHGFASSPCAVIKQPGQFPWASKKVRIDHNEFQESLELAYRVVEHNLKVVSDNVLFFNHKHVPFRNLRKITRIGNHDFYSFRKY